jgi:enterochelin esterase-like enzyme
MIRVASPGTKPWCRLVLALVLTVGCRVFSAAQSFTGFADFLRTYEMADAESQENLARSFIDWQQAQGGFPIRESDGKVVFVYIGNGNERDVRLTGDFRQSSPFNVYWDSRGEPMSRVGSVFYYRHTFEIDARLDYKFIVDGKDQRDPLNPRTLVSGSGGGIEVSELIMPGHHSPVMASGPVRGSLHSIEESWAKPAVTIYLPPDYDSARSYPTIYTADGTAWLDLIRLPSMLEHLVTTRAMEPAIAVMIDAAVDRTSWYSYNPEYLTYLRRVVEYVDTHYATRREPEARLHAGTSAGGRASAFVGLELPDLFHNIALLSPTFNGPIYYFEPYFSRRKRPDPRLRLWISAGTYEGAIYDDVHTMEAYFRSVNISVKTLLFHQGHSFGAWRESAIQMLVHFFPTQP